MLSAPVWFLGRRGWQLVRTRAPDMPRRNAANAHKISAE
jgi:hypothetical protein